MYKKPPALSAKEAAIHLLSRRDHGEYELSEKLKFKGYSEQDIEQAISICHEYGYLNDQRFAESQVRQHLFKGHGERRIRQELAQKRVNEGVIDSVLSELEVDWFEAAKEQAEKKFRGKVACDQKEYAKQVRFLQYRGYSFEQIKYALSKDETDS